MTMRGTPVDGDRGAAAALQPHPPSGRLNLHVPYLPDELRGLMTSETGPIPPSPDLRCAARAHGPAGSRRSSVRPAPAPTPEAGLEATRDALAPLIDELRTPLDESLQGARSDAEELRYTASALHDRDVDAWLTRTRTRLSELAARGLLGPTTDVDSTATALGAALIGGRAAALRARSISVFDAVAEGAVVLLYARP